MAPIPRRTNLRLLFRRPTRLLRAYWPPLLLLLAGATCDGLTTWVNLRLYGPEIELHLVQRWVFHTLGIGLGVPVAKAIQCAFVILVACWWRPWCGWILGGCGVLYGLAALSNHFHWL